MDWAYCERKMNTVHVGAVEGEKIKGSKRLKLFDNIKKRGWKRTVTSSKDTVRNGGLEEK